MPAQSTGRRIRALQRAADFQRALALSPRSRSTHFAVHHAAARPSLPARAATKPEAAMLSTGHARDLSAPVDDFAFGHWLGTVVPKRHARRSVTRNLLKRQMRQVMEGLCARLDPGLWVLRLRAPFDPRAFRSAASEALRVAARTELTQLMQRLAPGAAQ